MNRLMTIYAECERYDYDACAIPFNFPSWNWQDGIEGKTCLRLARILTTAVNSTYTFRSCASQVTAAVINNT